MNSNKIKEFKKHLKLTDFQRQVLVGILLGDASLETQNKGRTYRLKIEQSEKHIEYLMHLYRVFKGWCLSLPHKRDVERNGKISVNFAFSTVSHGAFRFYAQQFYKNGKKKVPSLIGKIFTSVSLAYWFMDDGSRKSRQSKGIIFNTQGFSKEDVNILINLLKDRYDLDAWLRKQKEGYQIYTSGKSFEVFKFIVLPYVVDNIKYKLD
ncbi:MAG: hypothetical protein GWP10_17595 [Nitrospiraceae bacterium]|nr:hypothetical protein [Nitrospiraceae bacterium]